MKSAFKVIAVIALATSSLVSVARHLAARVVEPPLNWRTRELKVK